MSANDRIYQVGVTLLAVPTGGCSLQVLPPRGTAAISVKYQSGGTLSIVNAFGMTTAQGWILSTSESQSFNGPAVFFLAANGSTSVAAIEFGYSAGFSSAP